MRREVLKRYSACMHASFENEKKRIEKKVGISQIFPDICSKRERERKKENETN